MPFSINETTSFKLFPRVQIYLVVSAKGYIMLLSSLSMLFVLLPMDLLVNLMQLCFGLVKIVEVLATRVLYNFDWKFYFE